MTGQALTVVPANPRNRSRVSNGATLFIEADGRSAWARRFADLVATYQEHAGGNVSAPTAALIRRIASLDLECERLEGELANGRPIDVDLLNRLAGGQRRLLAQLGFQAAARVAVNPLSDYFSRPVVREPAR